jgi:four helix bundle protein
MAKGSLSEVQSLLSVALDQAHSDAADFRKAYDKANEISRLITAYIKGMRANASKGLKA